MDPLVRRKPGAEPRSEILVVRLTPTAMRDIDKMAVADGLNRSDEARSLLRVGIETRKAKK